MAHHLLEIFICDRLDTQLICKCDRSSTSLLGESGKTLMHNWDAPEDLGEITRSYTGNKATYLY